MFYNHTFIMKKVIFTEDAPKPIGPYSQAIQVGQTLYISGQIALDPITAELQIRTIEEETHRVLDNVQAILKAAGMDFSHVVKCSVFVKDIKQFNAINAVYATYFPKADPPARELVEVVNLQEGNNLHELDLSTYAKGMYFLSLKAEGSETKTIRIVVE